MFNNDDLGGLLKMLLPHLLSQLIPESNRSSFMAYPFMQQIFDPYQSTMQAYQSQQMAALTKQAAFLDQQTTYGLWSNAVGPEFARVMGDIASMPGLGPHAAPFLMMGMPSQQVAARNWYAGESMRGLGYMPDAASVFDIMGVVNQMWYPEGENIGPFRNLKSDQLSSLYRGMSAAGGLPSLMPFGEAASIADEVIGDIEDLSAEGRLAAIRRVQTHQITETLKSYANIFNALGEAFGPGTSGDELLQALEAFTGGRFAVMSQPQLESVAQQVRGISRLTGLSGQQLTQSAIAGIQYGAARGLESHLGAQVGLGAELLTAHYRTMRSDLGMGAPTIGQARQIYQEGLTGAALSPLAEMRGAIGLMEEYGMDIPSDVRGLYEDAMRGDPDALAAIRGGQASSMLAGAFGSWEALSNMRSTGMFQDFVTGGDIQDIFRMRFAEVMGANFGTSLRAANVDFQGLSSEQLRSLVDPTASASERIRRFHALEMFDVNRSNLAALDAGMYRAFGGREPFYAAFAAMTAPPSEFLAFTDAIDRLVGDQLPDDTSLLGLMRDVWMAPGDEDLFTIFQQALINRSATIELDDDQILGLLAMAEDMGDTEHGDRARESIRAVLNVIDKEGGSDRFKALSERLEGLSDEEKLLRMTGLAGATDTGFFDEHESIRRSTLAPIIRELKGVDLDELNKIIDQHAKNIRLLDPRAMEEIEELRKNEAGLSEELVREKIRGILGEAAVSERKPKEPREQSEADIDKIVDGAIAKFIDAIRGLLETLGIKSKTTQQSGETQTEVTIS